MSKINPIKRDAILKHFRNKISNRYSDVCKCKHYLDKCGHCMGCAKTEEFCDCK